MRFQRLLGRSMLGLSVASLMAAEAWAQVSPGSVTFAPPVAAVPTLSETMMVVLGLALAALAYRTLRRFPGGTPMAAVTAFLIAAGALFSGVQLISEARALPAPTISNPAGGTVTIPVADVNVSIQNTSGVSLQVTAVTPGDSCYSAVTPTGSPYPQCTAGSIVAHNGYCAVKFQGDCA